ncbi:MAG: membrane protein insertion efficiency factor YidD [Pseudomonadota bacterium]
MLKISLTNSLNRFFAWALLGLISLYQFLLSPFFGGQCRFQPSCSHYAKQAIGVYGPWRGSTLAIWRICRCNPFCEGGHDPIPPRISLNSFPQPIPKSSHHDGSQT